MVQNIQEYTIGGMQKKEEEEKKRRTGNVPQKITPLAVMKICPMPPDD